MIDPYVYQEALDLMDLHRSEGRRIYIVSSSPEEIVRPLARHFGVSGVIATQSRGRRRRSLHGRPGVLRLRRTEGRGDRADRVPRRHRPLGVLRVQRLHHRPPDARGRRGARGGEPRQGPPEDRRGARLADPRLPPAGAARARGSRRRFPRPSRRSLAAVGRSGRGGGPGVGRVPVARRRSAPPGADRHAPRASRARLRAPQTGCSVETGLFGGREGSRTHARVTPREACSGPGGA